MTEVSEQIVDPVNDLRTIYSGTLTRQLKSAQELGQPKISPSTIVFLALNVGWIGAFTLAESLPETFPWAITFLICAGASIAVTFGTKWMNSLALFRIGDNRWSTFPGSLAISASVISFLFAFFAFVHYWAPDRSMLVNRQVIDIELVSPHDYRDRHDIAPSTQKEQLVTAEKNLPAKAAAPSPPKVVARAVPIKHTAATIAPEHKIAASPPQVTVPVKARTAGEQAFVIRQQPDAPSPGTVAPPKAVPRAKPVVAMRNKLNEISLEEVSPAQLMEVPDKSDEPSGEISQTGGHSQDGAGSQPLLVAYLNDIHKRIKRAWSPPQGETRSARILFRVKKNGRLASLKLVDSCGTFSSDQSAMHAIVAAAPFKALPAEYSSDYLDLLYTFNYTRDEISEVGKNDPVY